MQTPDLLIGHHLSDKSKYVIEVDNYFIVYTRTTIQRDFQGLAKEVC